MQGRVNRGLEMSAFGRRVASRGGRGIGRGAPWSRGHMVGSGLLPSSLGEMLKPQGPPEITNGSSLWASETNSRSQAWPRHFLCRKRLEALASLSALRVPPDLFHFPVSPSPFPPLVYLPGALCPFHPQTAQLWPESLGLRPGDLGDLGWEAAR